MKLENMRCSEPWTIRRQRRRRRWVQHKFQINIVSGANTVFYIGLASLRCWTHAHTNIHCTLSLCLIPFGFLLISIACSPFPFYTFDILIREKVSFFPPSFCVLLMSVHQIITNDKLMKFQIDDKFIGIFPCGTNPFESTLHAAFASSFFLAFHVSRKKNFQYFHCTNWNEYKQIVIFFFLFFYRFRRYVCEVFAVDQ